MDVIEGSKCVTKYDINQIDALELCSNSKINDLLMKTHSLKNIDIDLLESIEDTTCFLINLSNLMWIHSLLFTTHGISICTYFFLR